MIYLSIRDRDAAAQATEPITSGSVGMRVGFSFSESWDGLAKVAVFRGSGQSIDVALTAGSCEVPHEVLQSAGGHLKIGVYGTGDEGQKVTPTVWADAGPIVEGAEPSEIEPTPATESLVQQILEAAEDARDLAQSVRDDADAGEFDGQNGEDGNSLWWTVSLISDASMPGQVYGKIRSSWLKGRSGTPAVHDLVVGPAVGTSGSIVWLYEIDSVAGIYCTLKGIGSIKGAPGEPGFAPVVTIETITGGHRVTITSAAHPEGQIFVVLDGSGGGADLFFVTYSTSDMTTWTCDKTFAQITAAMAAGKQIVIVASVGGVPVYQECSLEYDPIDDRVVILVQTAIDTWARIIHYSSNVISVSSEELIVPVPLDQGVSEAGKFLVVGSDGFVTTMTLSTWQGGNY